MSKSAYRYIESYVHDGRIGVLVEFSLDTDFTSKTDVFLALAKDIGMHIAACNPLDTEQLLNQEFVKDVDMNVEEVIQNARQQLSDNITVTRFVRWNSYPESPDPNTTPPKSPSKLASVVDIRGKDKR